MRIRCRMLTVAVAFLLLACSDQSTKVVSGPEEVGEPIERTIGNTIERVNNCGSSGDIVYKSSSESIASGEVVKWEVSGQLGAGAFISAILGGVDLSGEFEAKYGKDYESSREAGIGWSLPAKPNEWIEYNIEWREVWQPGIVVVERGGKTEIIKYQYRLVERTLNS